MTDIRELSVTQLHELVEFINRHWNELRQRPSATEAETNFRFWKKLQEKQRILVYRGADEALCGLLTVSKIDDITWLDHLFVIPELRSQGIGTKLIKMAEHMAHIWMTPVIRLQCHADNKLIPFFHRRGYGLQYYSTGEKNRVTLEKKL